MRWDLVRLSQINGGIFVNTRKIDDIEVVKFRPAEQRSEPKPEDGGFQPNSKPTRLKVFPPEVIRESQRSALTVD